MTRCIITCEHVNAAIDNKSFKEIYIYTQSQDLIISFIDLEEI